MEISYAFFARAASAAADGIDILGADLQTLPLEQAGGRTFTRTTCFLVAIRFRQEESGRLYRLSSKLITPTGQPINVEEDVVAPRVEKPEEISSRILQFHLDDILLSGPGLCHMRVRIEDSESHEFCEKDVPIQAIVRINHDHFLSADDSATQKANDGTNNH
jgi:hypothetical protein